MLLEDIVLAIAVGVVLVIVGVPIIRFLKVAPWRQRDPLAEAHKRLRMAQREAEAARVNREAEKIYERLYDEALAEDHGRAGARVAGDDQADIQAVDETAAKGKGHGHD